jgi:CBS domain-containing protein
MAVGYATHVLVEPSSGAPAGIVSSLDIAAAVGGVPFGLARMPLSALVMPPPGARSLQEACVGDVMHPGVITSPPDASLATVARIMAERGVHCVAIAGVDRSEGRDPHLTWGLISDIDLIRAVHGGSPATAPGLTAGTIAATAPIALHEDDFLDRAAALMVKHDTSHLVAVNRTGLPSGMVSTFDVARVMALPAPTHRLPGGT